MLTTENNGYAQVIFENDSIIVPDFDKMTDKEFYQWEDSVI
jgi:hypothetical protein